MKAKSVLPVLWQHQAEAIHASQDALKRGVTRQLVSIPTGGGKSRVAVEIVRARQGRALFIAHRQELLDQMREHLIGSGLAEKSIGIEKAERREIDRPVVIASVQTLSNAKRLARLGHDFTTLSIDEAHHSTALSYMRVLQHAGAFEPKGPLVLGITATPYRGDQSSLDAVYSEKVFEVSIPTLMKREILCPVRAIQVDLKVDFDKVKRIGGDFSDKDSGQALMKADAPRHVVSAYRQNALGRRTIVFCPTVEVSKAMMEAFRARKISAEHLDGTTPADERAAILGRLARGTTKVLTNCAIVGEGFDLPGLECVVMARPTLSPVLFAQCIGRGMRVAPGKTDCLIIDCVGASQRHNLMSTAEFFGVKGHE
ncbi:MAG TPA: DEAD/DEAH box helicase, partial [Methylomirabilota bacterium]|nr:DEAD/DEAH box helicase [Methylomirabilota bacterium]